ncbi:MAG: MerR family DNA-binding transcriptional regulator [Luteitalea sp.]|nr:MerR family DNA-binding transcriptional regulator [Luteitalea sp.]
MSTRKSRWQVSDLAAEFQLNPRTIRYYEHVGLLKASTRTAAGYRLWRTLRMAPLPRPPQPMTPTRISSDPAA